MENPLNDISQAMRQRININGRNLQFQIRRALIDLTYVKVIELLLCDINQKIRFASVEASFYAVLHRLEKNWFCYIASDDGKTCPPHDAIAIEKLFVKDG